MGSRYNVSHITSTKISYCLRVSGKIQLTKYPQFARLSNSIRPLSLFLYLLQYTPPHTHIPRLCASLLRTYELITAKDAMLARKDVHKEEREAPHTTPKLFREIQRQ